MLKNTKLRHSIGIFLLGIIFSMLIGLSNIKEDNGFITGFIATMFALVVMAIVTIVVLLIVKYFFYD